MASEEHRILLNRAINEYRAALKKLEEARTLLEVVGERDAAAALEISMADMNLRLEATKALSRTAKSVSRANKKLPTKHPLQDYLLDTWAEAFPVYGNPTPRDFKELKIFFAEFAQAYPHAKGKAGEILLRRMVFNYRESTADFTSVKRLYNFSRNLHHFVSGPAHSRTGGRIDRRDDGGSLSAPISDAVRVPGFAGIVIPKKKDATEVRGRDARVTAA